MNKVVIAAVKPWNIRFAQEFIKNNPQHEILLLTQKEDLTYKILEKFAPDYVFFPHWSWIIPKEIYETFRCVVFHMTDLPFGRGGSPLQNLISREYTETCISALAVDGGIDTGNIYCKHPVSLYGGGEEIYMRVSRIVFFHMIPHILENNPNPVPQEGKITAFARRTPQMSQLSPDMTLQQIFDHIRMLDVEDYPHAFLMMGGYRITFSRPKITSKGIIADVMITQEETNAQ